MQLLEALLQTPSLSPISVTQTLPERSLHYQLYLVFPQFPQVLYFQLPFDIATSWFCPLGQSTLQQLTLTWTKPVRAFRSFVVE